MFWADESDNLIRNKQAGSRIPYKGPYLIYVRFFIGGTTEIIVDSGAEAIVCPQHWGSQFGLQPVDRWMNFRSVSGIERLHIMASEMFE